MLFFGLFDWGAPPSPFIYFFKRLFNYYIIITKISFLVCQLCCIFTEKNGFQKGKK